MSQAPGTTTERENQHYKANAGVHAQQHEASETIIQLGGN
jgi:hypothetical protein